MAKENTFATSTFYITKPETYEKLEEQYTLVRYLIPTSFAEKSKKERYKLLHVELRGQLFVPYRTFDYDELDGAYRHVIYALYPKNAESTSITLSFLSNDALEHKRIGFHQMSTFNLIKLLQADYFNTYPHFASMGDYFIHAKPSGKDWHICLEISIHGATQNITADKKEEKYQKFWVTGQAKYFTRPQEHPNDYQKTRFPYYSREIRDGYIIFKQLTPDQIDQHRDELFYQYSKKSHPARLVYHAQNKTKLLPSRGLLLHQFTTAFVERLQTLGINAQIKHRNWTQYTPPKHAKSLPRHLKQIHLFDNRQNKATHSITSYQSLLAEHYGDYEFSVIQTIEEAECQPVLIIQDTNSDDYEEGGVLFGHVDPYKQIYRKYQDTPKQSINVNVNGQEDFKGTQDAYLSYPMISLTDISEEDEDEDEEENGVTETTWAIQFQVSLYQLYLKNVVINQKKVSEYLPISGNLKALMNYIYIRKQTYKGTSYHVAVRVADDHLKFYDLRDPEQKVIFSEVTQVWGYDWLDIEDMLYQKYHKKREEGQEVRDYDLILMPKRAVELETVDETVIYKYSELERRLGTRSARQPVDQLFLMPHYDKLREKGMLSYEDLEALGLLGGRKPDGRSETASVKFWKSLQEYDELLEEVSTSQSRITYDEFVSMRRNEIGRIFKFKKNKKGEYNTNPLLKFYKLIWDVHGFKSDDVQMSKGIWYDLADLAYTVGDVNGFKNAQDKANLVRRFDVLYGDKAEFNLEELLEATAVQFIRYRQYTVYPYPFYLIEKYIQDVLFHL